MRRLSPAQAPKRAILVRVGLKGISAVESGRPLLNRFGSLRGMVEASLLALLDIKGLKGAKPAQLLAAMEEAMKRVKVIIEKHPDGYVAYPVGIRGVAVGEGDSYEDAPRDVQSALRFHVETFGTDVLDGDEPPVLEAFVAEASV